jgi:hypothetical protein
LLLAFQLAAPAPASAATVALSDVHMAAKSGANQPSAVHFPTKTGMVYFDYTVITPSAGDSGQIKVFAGSPSGKLIASADLIFGIAASFYATLAPAGGVWPDGSYCSVLYIDGATEALNGAMPIGWSVGKVTTPGCTLRSLHLKVSTTVHVVHGGRISVLVRGPKHPVRSAVVKLNGSSVGLPAIREAQTNSAGACTFKRVKPARTGTIIITASKPGFRSAKKTLTVKS